MPVAPPAKLVSTCHRSRDALPPDPLGVVIMLTRFQIGISQRVRTTGFPNVGSNRSHSGVNKPREGVLGPFGGSLLFLRGAGGG